MDVYNKVKKFKKKYKGTVAFRLKAHSEVLEKHLNPGEEVLYVFAGQKNNSSIDGNFLCAAAWSARS